jgi:uroporphyrinogen III methyltransferase / synthase
LAPGKVYLIGAGPGDPELLTIKAQRLLREADVVLYDRLLSPKILEGLGAEVELIDVGKSAGRHKLTQEGINQLLIEKASQGKVVARLKGGDPYVFGRGGEEALALLEKGIPVETVPGVTSAIAAPELAGIPVTHRKVASTLTIVTGHEEPGKDNPLDWSVLAKLTGTLVVLMGMARLEENISLLLGGGKSPKTPAALVEKGGWPEQRLVTGTLGDIASRAREANVQPPAILVVGEVVELSKSLAPKKIAILRPDKQMEESADLARRYGFLPICAPAISLAKKPLPEDILERIRGSDCVVFTSANGVNMALKDEKILAALKDKTVASIGPKTRQALDSYSVPSIVPDEYSSSGLSRLLAGRFSRVILLRSAQGSQELVSDLKAAGVQVEDIHLYEVEGSQDPRLDDLIRRASEVDVFAFTSSSTARCLFQRAEDLGLKPSLRKALESATTAVMGQPTAAELKRLGVHVDVVPEEFTFESMLQALWRHR